MLSRPAIYKGKGCRSAKRERDNIRNRITPARGGPSTSRKKFGEKLPPLEKPTLWQLVAPQPHLIEDRRRSYDARRASRR